MGTLFLTTVITCRQLLGIASRITNSSVLTSQQKTEIVIELRNLVPSCPIVIKPYDPKRTPGN